MFCAQFNLLKDAERKSGCYFILQDMLQVKIAKNKSSQKAFNTHFKLLNFIASILTENLSVLLANDGKSLKVCVILLYFKLNLIQLSDTTKNWICSMKSSFRFNGNIL